MTDKPHPKNSIFQALAALLIVVALPALCVEIPDTPDGTVIAVAEALADRHPEVLWHALPSTYQRDITELTHVVAQRMDPNVWEAAFGLGLKLTGILRDKKAIILESKFLDAAGDERQRIEDGWDTGVSVLNDFVTSDLSSLETLQTMDWGNFLTTTGRDLMIHAAEASKTNDDNAFDREFTQKLEQTKVEVVTRDDNQATVRVSSPDEDPEEVDLTRVEGRWVPSDMAADWDQKIAEAKQELADASDEEIQQSSMQAMMVIGMIDGVLTQLETVETSEQLEQAIQGFLGPFLGGGMGPGFQPAPDPESTES